MIESAKCMFHKLLGEASDDLESVTPQSGKSLHIETIRNAHRCSSSETPSCAVKLDSASKTQPSRESLEQVADDDVRKHLELSVPLHKLGEWKYGILDVIAHNDDTELALRRSRTKGQDSKSSYVH